MQPLLMLLPSQEGSLQAQSRSLPLVLVESGLLSASGTGCLSRHLSWVATLLSEAASGLSMSSVLVDSVLAVWPKRGCF